MGTRYELSPLSNHDHRCTGQAHKCGPYLWAWPGGGAAIPYNTPSNAGRPICNFVLLQYRHTNIAVSLVKPVNCTSLGYYPDGETSSLPRVMTGRARDNLTSDTEPSSPRSRPPTTTALNVAHDCFYVTSYVISNSPTAADTKSPTVPSVP